MNFGVQYYRPSFPEQKYWKDDFARIKDSGLDTVQFWIVWAWVESKPGRFRFDDYDTLIELANKNGLKVVLSTVAEIHPYWIHREIPESEMINHLGNKVVSTNRTDCNFGLSPGGCFDHPDVWKRMRRFLEKTVLRFGPAENLKGWDAWNELRWNVHADSYVCFCEYTLRNFQEWLGQKYVTLAQLNETWKRRYGSFKEIMPGKTPSRPYTEMMAFEAFLTWRSNQHGKKRYEAIKEIDPHHPVVVHGSSPSPLTGDNPYDHALNRGNDWFFADDVDGIGCSNFPKSAETNEVDFAVRMDCLSSAAQNKEAWLSELHGGAASIGPLTTGLPVDAFSQQRWVWQGIGAGAKTIIFWCWRDEVFGQESSGFGISGNDGLREERLEATEITGSLLKKYRSLIDNYRPFKPEVGIFFSPSSYQLYWAQEGNPDRPVFSFRGYASALTRRGIPFAVIEENHLDVFGGMKIVFLPRTIVVDDTVAASLSNFVRQGGVLVCESECGAFDANGFYRYPENRFIKDLAGCMEVGRRTLTGGGIEICLKNRRVSLPATQWLTPWKGIRGDVLSRNSEGVLLGRVNAGKGRLILCSTYLGDAYMQKREPEFEEFLEQMVFDAGCKKEIRLFCPKSGDSSSAFVRYGTSLNKKVVFVLLPAGCKKARLWFNRTFFTGSNLRDIITGKTVFLTKKSDGYECTILGSKWNVSIITEE